MTTMSTMPSPPAERLSGAQIVVRLLERQGTRIVTGYPGGAILPIYDALGQSTIIRHVLARHEQGAGFIAQGMARATGEVGVCMASSGPGATNLLTAIADAKLDSIPLVAITGQVPRAMIGTDAFQEVDTYGLSIPITKHNFLVSSAEELLEVIPRAFEIAASGRPGPVLIDIPKDVQFATAEYVPAEKAKVSHYQPRTAGDPAQIARLVELMESAERPIIYSGGGVINSGTRASQLRRELVAETNFPITSTLMGLGSYPASGKNWIGMLGMHGLYEANLAMHGCDVMINIGARFDDRITGNLGKFSPGSKKIHVDIDPSSINKNVRVDLPIVGDATLVLEEMIKVWKAKQPKTDQKDALPVYELSFLFLENGVSRNLLIDYGDFAIQGDLKEIDFFEPAKCEKK